MERVPILHAFRLGSKARIPSPVRRAHGLEQGRPLAFFARRNRDITIACRQDRDGGAVAVRLAFPRPALAGKAGARELGDSECGERLLYRYVDRRATLLGQHRVHARAGSGKPAKKRGLFADRTDRRLREVVHLSGQKPRNPASTKQCQICRGLNGSGTNLPKGRNENDCRRFVKSPKTLDVILLGTEFGGSALADD